jgi:hypothetical protein
MATASSGAKITVKNMNTRVSRDRFGSGTISGELAIADLQVRGRFPTLVICFCGSLKCGVLRSFNVEKYQTSSQYTTLFAAAEALTAAGMHLQTPILTGVFSHLWLIRPANIGVCHHALRKIG